jgi:Bardet-Biedl syndrome 9 protein
MMYVQERSTQFRSVQKRLLLKFKERNPTPVSHLESLFQGTYQQLNELATQLSQAQQHLRQAGNVLACSTMVVLTVLKFQHALDDAVRTPRVTARAHMHVRACVFVAQKLT